MATQTTTASPLLQLDVSYGDWRDDLRTKGYAVVKGAIPRERAVEYQQRALKWLTSFGLPLDLDDPSTWLAENMPVQSKLNTFDNYCVVHEKFMWDARMEPGVVDAFSKVWNTNELLVSFDSLNITLPGRKDKSPRAPWPHVDQSPFKRGLHCIQGIINLSHVGDEDGSLMVLPGSNAYNAEFFDSQADRSSWPEIDWRRFSEEEMKWFEGKGLKACKVKAEPGDLILWDSRTVHWGAEPTGNSKTIRTVIYASYSPAKLAKREALEEKARVFNVYGATTHWAHDNIWLRPQLAHLPDDSQPASRRIVVGISGVPGSGKTTLARLVTARINELRPSAKSTPTAGDLAMGGFHYSRAHLAAMPDPVFATHRRGAAFTFDAAGFLALVRQLVAEPPVEAKAPSLDHSTKDPVADDVAIPSEVRIVLVEGNYCALNRAPWSDAAALMTELWYVDTPAEVSHKRLAVRHLQAGIVKDEEEAWERATGTDVLNAKDIRENRLPCQENLVLV
ncbi:hypothetical protein K4K61_000541 [Colletotrichum sp. SAR11_59]|nr:hypothetical protein K4K61_000541 [Colletotrichum sp. SAR11_59]